MAREIIFSIEDSELYYMFQDFFDWLEVKPESLKIVNVEGYKYELILDDKRFMAFWDYGNDRLHSALAQKVFRHYNIWSQVDEELIRVEEFLIYNHKKSEFSLIEVVELFDWRLGNVDKTLIFPKDSVELIIWRCPKHIAKKWLADVYWKRPYYLTLDYERFQQLLDNEISIREIKPILVLRATNYELWLYRDRIEKHEVIYECDNIMNM